LKVEFELVKFNTLHIIASHGENGSMAIFGDFWVLHLQRAACSTFQTCILNSH